MFARDSAKMQASRAFWCGLLLSVICEREITRAFAQLGNKNGKLQWAWLHGEPVGNQHTNEAEILLSGEKVPTAASQKHGFFYPGSRAGATWWQLRDGTVWMFGGQGFDDKPTEEARLLNDLWEFDTTKQSWRLVDDVDPRHANEDSNHEGPIPRRRKLAAACGIPGIVFAVFGGEGADGRVLNDTWLYDDAKSEWLHLRMGAAEPSPQPRKDMAYWCTRGKMVLFGGVDARGRTLGDMWEFSLKRLRWSEISLGDGGDGDGDDDGDGDGEKRRGGVVPGGRAGAFTWGQVNGSLFMYGGFSTEEGGGGGGGVALVGLADLWEFNVANSSWTPLHASCSSPKAALVAAETNDTVVLMAAGLQPDRRDPRKDAAAAAGEEKPTGACPGARRHGAAWTETTGNLWLYGGEMLPFGQPVRNDSPRVYSTGSGSGSGSTTSDVITSRWFMSDLWEFDVTEGAWWWRGLSLVPGEAAHYGTNYEPSADNHPGARCQMITWTRKGQMFLYGGLGLDARNKTAYLNDVWLMIHPNVSYSFTVQRDWFRQIPPSTIFLVTLGSFGGVVFAFGVGFYLKKMLESPNHSPGEFRVKYSRVRQDPFFDQ